MVTSVRVIHNENWSGTTCIFLLRGKEILRSRLSYNMTGSSRTEVQRSSYSWVNEAHLLVSMIQQFEYCDNKETKSHLADNRQKVYMTGDQNIPHAIQLKIHAVL